MDTLTLLKTLLCIDTTDTSKDTVLNFYLEKAKNAIINDLNYDETDYTNANLTNQTVELAEFYYENKKYVGIKSGTEGSRSKTFEDGSIPSSIKGTLPLPRVKLF